MVIMINVMIMVNIVKIGYTMDMIKMVKLVNMLGNMCILNLATM